MKIAYGRFALPTSGHAKLFKLADAVVCSKSPSSKHMDLLAKFSGKPVVSVQAGSLIDFLRSNASVDCVVLGSDNAALAKAVVKLGCSVVLVQRSCEDVSSTKVRASFANGEALSELCAKGYFESIEQASIAYELWRQ